MGIYIPNMEIPKHCIDCPFMVSRGNDDCILQSAEANENFENWEQMKACCPIVFVPPHGRMIDADALKESFYRNFDMIFGTEFNDLVKGLLFSAHILGDAPTVIPKDKDGESDA